MGLRVFELPAAVKTEMFNFFFWEGGRDGELISSRHLKEQTVWLYTWYLSLVLEHHVENTFLNLDSQIVTV